MKYLDLTHIVNSKTPVYPGDSPVKITKTGTYKKDGFLTHQLTMGMHMGTHIDAAWHMIRHGKNIAETKVDRFIGKGVLIDARGIKKISKDVLENVKIEKGSIVLVFTGFDKKYNLPEYFKNYPAVAEDFAKILVKSGICMFGSDTPSPDYAPFKIHKLLLSKGILIIENLTNLEKLIGVKDFEIIALPAKFALDGAPARVVARIIKK